jgi:hypothetical protein
MAVAALAGSRRGPAGVGILLPTTLSADESSGGLGLMGHREIEGVTPKQLPPPASHALPNSEQELSHINKINDLGD